jgi:type II secretion system protein G
MIRKKYRGFTLIELLVVISIIGLLATIVMVSLNSARGKARDARRASDMQQIQKALELYLADNGQYPVATCPCGSGGWETSDVDPNQFMEYLAPYMSKVPVDPINKRDVGFSFFGPRAGNYFYAYYRYNTPYVDCPDIEDPFAVIGFFSSETSAFDNLQRAICGDLSGGCPEGGISGVCRDWNTEFSYTVMLKEGH